MMIISPGLTTRQPMQVVCVKWYIDLVWYWNGYDGAIHATCVWSENVKKIFRFCFVFYLSYPLNHDKIVILWMHKWQLNMYQN